MKMRACDFMTKPCALGDLEHHCLLARDRGQLRKENQQLKANNFREDLFYRINVLSVHLPPLRDREGDIDRLIDRYLPATWRVHPLARQALNRYSWPGNVRQLLSVLQRGTILADGEELTLYDLPSEIADGAESDMTAEASKCAIAFGDKEPPIVRCESVKLDDIARAHVLDVLAREGGNKAKAARKLGIHRRVPIVDQRTRETASCGANARNREFGFL